MATIASNVSWGSSPTNTFDFSYEKKREGSTQYYKVTVSCDPCTGGSYFGYPIYLEIKLAGTKAATKTLKDAYPDQWSSAISYTTGWLSVPNKTDGTTSLAIRIYSGMGSSRNTTYSYSLPIDPAAGKISATDANIESTSTITITKYDSKFTTTVAYKAAGQSSYTTIWTKQTHTSYGWKIPDSLYSLIPKAKEIEIELRCQTYSGSTLIGTETCTLTAKTSESKCKPDVSVTAVDTNTNTTALTGSNKKIIKGFSNVKVTTTATVKNSADGYSVSVTCGSEKKTGTSVTFSGAESATVKATVEDGRGYSNNATASGLTLINYIKPTIVAAISRESPTSDIVNISVKGNWFNGSFGSVTNTLKAQVRYKPKSQTEYTDSDKYYDMTVETSGNTYTATLSLTGLVYTSAYSIRIRVSDAIHVYNGPIAEPVYKNTNVSNGIPLFDWGESDFQFNIPARFRASADALEDSNGNVAIRVGNDEAQHIDIDTNEIMAKEDASRLGDLSIGGSGIYLNVNGERAFKCDADGNQSALPLTVSQGGYAVGGPTATTKIYAGKVTITPSAADTATAVTVKFPTGFFSSTPFVIVTPQTTVPERCSCGIYGASKDSVDIYLTRTNTSATAIHYICVGT